MKCIHLFLGLAFLLSNSSLSYAQAPSNWFNLDAQTDQLLGVSTEKTYQKLTQGRKPTPIVVAVLDNGVDYEHEDLKDKMWVNPGEIPGNGIDDDQNGYIDDVHGWNFLGNPNGENVQFDNLELTRLYVEYQSEFEGKSEADIPKKDKERFLEWQEWGKLIEKKNESIKEDYAFYSLLNQALVRLKEDLPSPITKESLKTYKASSEIMDQVSQLFLGMMDQYNWEFKDLEKDIQNGYDYFHTQAKHYDTELDARSIVGDNYSDLDERSYGNNDVRGPDAEHGTHVAGIIGAKRNNQLGIDGVAAPVQIMAVRMLAAGDERDKDVANAIRYAVDNGASVINMSFGKGQSPNKKVVDEAVKYAMKHDVLLVHAAGNDGAENLADNNFPVDYFAKKKLFAPRYANNWIEVGASTPSDNENLPASFSNYSNFFVDVFAPGVEMYSTVPYNQYETFGGTSQAAPVVSGIAAMLRAYFPELTAKQVKQIIMDSAVRQKAMVNMPGSPSTKVPFRQLSVTGGVVNLYGAFQLASQTKGKKKIKNGAGAQSVNQKGKKEQAIP